MPKHPLPRVNPSPLLSPAPQFPLACRAAFWLGSLLALPALPAAAQSGSPGAYRVIAVPEEHDALQHAEVEGATLRPARRDFDPAYLTQLNTPPGFQVEVWAEGLENPRIIRVAPSGRAYVSEREAGRVRMLFDANGDGRAEVSEVVAEGLDQVHGLAIHDGWLYLASIKQLGRAPILDNGFLGELQLLSDQLPDAGQHNNRVLDVGPDGLLYLSIGSLSNATPEKGLSAVLLRGNLDASDAMVFAEGLRNTIAFDWHPLTGELWGLDNGSDMRGDNLPPEELNRIREGGHYGWPFCFADRQPDYLLAEDPQNQTKQEFCATTEAMEMAYTAHTAPLQMLFYEGDALPPEYVGDAFVTMRGSWNRSPAVGYEILHIRFDDQGEPQWIRPFIGSWLLENGQAHFGRLAGLAETVDGALLVSDDSNGIIYRISYEP